MAALVIKNQSCLTLKGFALEIPGIQTQGVTVAENNCKWRIGLIDFDMKRRTVFGNNFALYRIELIHRPLIVRF
ncbi:unannotated protein [freshwater metagenome]|uniref:Unannotated protein n=1 Tax=freshwater metagenome TaxID=449393 RepID=A0A6J7PHF3_9ZZZZ